MTYLTQSKLEDLSSIIELVNASPVFSFAIGKEALSFGMVIMKATLSPLVLT
jgi:hypothetical protein